MASSRAIKSRLAVLGSSHGFVQNQRDGIASPFRSGMHASVVNQDLPHHPGGHGKKVRPVLPGREPRLTSRNTPRAPARWAAKCGRCAVRQGTCERCGAVRRKRAEPGHPGGGIPFAPAGQQISYRVRRSRPHTAPQAQEEGLQRGDRRYPGSDSKSTRQERIDIKDVIRARCGPARKIRVR